MSSIGDQTLGPFTVCFSDTWLAYSQELTDRNKSFEESTCSRLISKIACSVLWGVGTIGIIGGVAAAVLTFTAVPLVAAALGAVLVAISIVIAVKYGADWILAEAVSRLLKGHSDRTDFLNSEQSIEILSARRAAAHKKLDEIELLSNCQKKLQGWVLAKALPQFSDCDNACDKYKSLTSELIVNLAKKQLDLEMRSRSANYRSIEALVIEIFQASSENDPWRRFLKDNQIVNVFDDKTIVNTFKLSNMWNNQEKDLKNLSEYSE